jgi:hypothetical protein
VIRINLLPPEIVQKRKDEKRWQWVAIGGVAAVIAVGLVFSALQLQVAGKQSEVASVRQQAEALQQKADIPDGRSRTAPSPGAWNGPSCSRRYHSCSRAISS